MSNDVALLVVIGKATHAELAANFVRTSSKIITFLERYQPPFIAKIDRPSASQLARNANARGEIELWYR